MYLEDWRVKAGDQPSGQRKQAGEALLTKGDAAGENASPIADDWDVDFGANSFGELTTEKRIMLAFVIFIKLCLVVGALYFFICALSFMATGFRLVSCSSSSVAWVGVVPAAVVVPCPHPTSLPPPHPPQVAGRQAGEVFANSEVFNNPVAGKLIGLEPRTLPPNPHLALTSPQPPFSNPNSNPDPRQACSWACS